jgi:hypothetical protein
MNPEMLKRVEDERRQDQRRQAEQWRLVRLASQGRSPGWLSRQGYWLLCQLGRWMVSLGRQLQQYSTYRSDPARP